jgi:hypothetical protein
MKPAGINRRAGEVRDSIAESSVILADARVSRAKAFAG